jgi:CubicO group peptidase (beta-lactamase class C family)
MRALEFEPGTRGAYSSYGFVLPGLVIEEVTGQSHYDYVRTHVYARAGMTRSGSCPKTKRSRTGRSDTRSQRAPPRRSRTPTHWRTAETPPVAVTRRSRTSHDLRALY